MAEVKETTILQEGLVKITNLRTLIGTKTFFISDITAVQLTKQAKAIGQFGWQLAVSYRCYGVFMMKLDNLQSFLT